MFSSRAGFCAPAACANFLMGEARRCGDCDLCCTVLRVDALGKLGGRRCRHQRELGAGCGIYATRPGICRDYRCLWLQGGLEPGDRPDRLGAVIDLSTREGPAYLGIRQLREGTFDASPRLQEIAESFRGTLPVRITRAEDAENPSRPYRVLLPDGLEQRVEGEWFEEIRHGRVMARQRMPMLERGFRRLRLAWQQWRGRGLT